MTKTNELNALLKKMIGKPMTKEQREELERLREQVKRGMGSREKLLAGPHTWFGIRRLDAIFRRFSFMNSCWSFLP